MSRKPHVFYCPICGTKMELHAPFMGPMDMTPYHGTCSGCKRQVSIKYWWMSSGYQIEVDPPRREKTAAEKKAERKEAEEFAQKRKEAGFVDEPMKMPSGDIFFLGADLGLKPRKVEFPLFEILPPNKEDTP